MDDTETLLRRIEAHRSILRILFKELMATGSIRLLDVLTDLRECELTGRARNESDAWLDEIQRLRVSLGDDADLGSTDR